MAVPQIDQPSLRYPEELAPQPNLTHDDAYQMLLRAVKLAETRPFIWKYVDKPVDGTIIVFFIQNNAPPPLDGLNYLEHESRYSVNYNNGELEIWERRFGFIPSMDQVASRLRRRYRLVRGGHPNLYLYHWSRGVAQNVPRELFSVLPRKYPLPPVTEPPLYVHGERRGQRVPPPGQHPHPHHPGQHPHPHPQQVQLAQQNQHMAALEARQRQVQAQAQAQAAAAAQRAPAQPVMAPRIEEDTDPADDLEHISTRTLAATRYRRNHEIMTEVFMHAAFGQRESEKPPSAYSIFDKAELEEKISTLTMEIQDLRAQAAARDAARAERDVGMAFEAEVPMAA